MSTERYDVHDNVVAGVCVCVQRKVDIVQFVYVIFIDNFSKHTIQQKPNAIVVCIHLIFRLYLNLMIENEERKKNEISSITNNKIQRMLLLRPHRIPRTKCTKSKGKM